MTSKPPLLTTAEVELLQAIADHGSISAAARRISTRTADAYALLEQVQSRLGLNSLIEALVVGFRAGLLQ